MISTGDPKGAKGFLFAAMVAMAMVVVISNILVQYPFTPFGLGKWLTWGAFSYPLSFFVTDLTNRQLGNRLARRVIYTGFCVALVLSAYLSEPRIALASGLAFLTGQLLDVTVFNRLRRQSWWRAPFFASGLGSVIDTTIFFSVAFAGTGLPWLSWAGGDLAVKLTFALGLLAPFRVAMAWFGQPRRQQVS